MKNSGTLAKTGVVLIAAACSCVGFESHVAAQGRTYSVARRIEKMENQADLYERDGLHRDREEKNATGSDRKKARAIAAQVTEDFERIQVIYNDLVRAMVAGKTLDPTSLSESVVGIHRCAGRLKTNLALPQMKDKTKANEAGNDVALERLTPSVTILLTHISNFVTNPLFESTGVLDIELSTKASLDLNAIVELSNSIRKSLEKTRQPH